MPSSAPLRIYSMASDLYTSHRIYTEIIQENINLHNAYERILRNPPEDIAITRKARTIPNVVFIVGESTTRNHMQIYGYELPTNPKLSARKDIHIFTDIVSPHVGTERVLRKMLTFCRYGSQDKWFTYTSLFWILKQSGCYTLLLSNQEYPAIGSCVELYHRQCSFSKFTEDFNRDSNKTAFYDEKLLEVIDDKIRSEHEENFYLVHLMGTHSTYSKRYPAEYSRFTSNDEGGLEGISSEHKHIRAEY